MLEDYDNLIEIIEEQKLGPQDQALPVEPVITIALSGEFYGRMQISVYYQPTDILQ